MQAHNPDLCTRLCFLALQQSHLRCTDLLLYREKILTLIENLFFFSGSTCNGQVHIWSQVLSLQIDGNIKRQFFVLILTAWSPYSSRHIRYYLIHVQLVHGAHQRRTCLRTLIARGDYKISSTRSLKDHIKSSHDMISAAVQTKLLLHKFTNMQIIFKTNAADFTREEKVR